MVIDGGLRERKKLETRSSLTAAALRLAVERGLDHVTAEDIAVEAGVSVRTFFNYFATKEAAFVDDDVQRGRSFVAAVAAAPLDTPVWALLHRTAVTTLATAELSPREQQLKEQLIRTSPALVSEVLATFGRLEAELVVELARRTAPSSALHSRLLATSLVAAVRAATETWLDNEHADTDTFVALLDEALSALAPAFPR